MVIPLPKLVRERLFSRTALCVACFTALPVLLLHRFWWQVWAAGASRAWDGSAHYGIAEIYDHSIFPDTFGWTNAHFGGMPFPNFYPPLFYWCVALLHHTHLFTFELSFKLVALTPLLIMPAAMWALAWRVSGGDRSVANWTTFVSLIPLIDPLVSGSAKWPSGLDYFSTVITGLYTQPLGFILLVAWYAVYLGVSERPYRFMFACLLLALTVLANFFNAVTAIVVVATTVAVDLVRYGRSDTPAAKCAARRVLLAHLTIPIVASCLTLFWVAPMLSTYEYFVSRPFTYLVLVVPMWVWYAAAAAGALCWLKRPTNSTWQFLMTCLALAVIIVFSAAVAPRWFPLQANRFSATLFFLLAVPVGYGCSAGFALVRAWCYGRFSGGREPGARPAIRGAVIGLLVLAAGASYFNFSPLLNGYVRALTSSFYPSPTPGAANPLDGAEVADAQSRKDAEILKLKSTNRWLVNYEGDFGGAFAAESLNQILVFAREHRDGRYLVEFPALYDAYQTAYDARAINAYLGAQGNETLTDVFREASPNALFMYPQVSALSRVSDNFGISSALAEDLDFQEQPLAKHLERARYLGVRYLVVSSASLKRQLAQELGAGARQRDFGMWSIFTLDDAAPPLIQELPYRPALVVGDFTLKMRRSNEDNFIRFAEEQFRDDWFDVLLVRSPESRIDRLALSNDLSQFGALIIDKYDYQDFEYAYLQLREFARERPLILIASDARLFHRIRSSIGDFPLARIIERPSDDPGPWMDSLYGPSHRFQSGPVSQEWAEIRGTLESHKIATEPVRISGEIDRQRIRLDYSSTSPAAAPQVPVLIRTTFHPRWQREDGEAVYSATPMFMLTFVKHSTSLAFQRQWLDRAGLWVSAGALIGLLCLTFWRGRRRSLSRHASGANRDVRADA